jgi:hypothetical protein
MNEKAVIVCTLKDKESPANCTYLLCSAGTNFNICRSSKKCPYQIVCLVLLCYGDESDKVFDHVIKHNTKIYI